MKNKIITLLISALSFACIPERNQLTINGVVSNYSKDFMLFISDTTGVGLTTLIDTIKIDKDGSFSIKKKSLTSNALLLVEHIKPISLTIPNTLTSAIICLRSKKE